MALGMEVDLGPVHIVLDGDTAPLPKTGGRAPQFSVHLYCGQTAACIKMPLVRYGPSYPQRKGTPTPPNFWPMSIVAKWLNG